MEDSQQALNMHLGTRVRQQIVQIVLIKTVTPKTGMLVKFQDSAISQHTFILKLRWARLQIWDTSRHLDQHVHSWVRYQRKASQENTTSRPHERCLYFSWFLYKKQFRRCCQRTSIGSYSIWLSENLSKTPLTFSRDALSVCVRIIAPACHCHLMLRPMAWCQVSLKTMDGLWSSAWTVRTWKRSQNRA